MDQIGRHRRELRWVAVFEVVLVVAVVLIGVALGLSRWELLGLALTTALVAFAAFRSERDDLSPP